MSKRIPFAVAISLLFIFSTATTAAPPETVLRFLVQPDAAGRSLRVQAMFELAAIPALKAPYLLDYNQLQQAELKVDGLARDFRLERSDDTVSFAGLPRKGDAVLTYTLFCVTEPRPGYRKRLMGGPGFVMAYAGVYLAIPGKEGQPVEISWQLPDGWTLGLGWQGKRSWRETQDTIWLAGSSTRVSSVEVDGRRLSLCILEGVAPETRMRLDATLGDLFRHAWQTCGPLPDADYAIAILPGGAIGGGASLVFSLAVEDDTVNVAHELLHWWSNHKAPAWFREGVHSYIAAAMLKRLGRLSDAEFSRFIQRCVREHERTVTDEGGLSTLADSSEAYEKSKGGGDMYGLMPLLAYRLDCEIKKQSNDTACLEDVFARVSRERTQRPNLPALIKKTTGYDPGPLFAQFFYAKVTDVDALLVPCSKG